MRTSLAVLALMAACIAVALPKDKGDQGNTVFQEQCIRCHGPDGRAQTDMGKAVQAADLTSSDVQQKSDGELEKSVKDGKGKMPPFKDVLSDHELKAVIAHVRGFSGKH